MQQKPEAYLENLSPSEKQSLQTKLKKKFNLWLFIFLPVFFICLAGVFYMNTRIRYEISQNVLTTLNVIFVFAGVLVTRLFLAQYNTYSKEKDSWQKKVIHGIVREKSGGCIKIGEHEIKLDKTQYANIREGEKIEVFLSPKSEIILGIKKTN